MFMTEVILVSFLFVLVAVTALSDSPRQRWEFGRFVKTARYFDALTPNLPFLPKLTNSLKPKLEAGTIIWNNEGKGAKAGVEWGPLDDVVMGGASKSDIEPGQKFSGKWTGFVTSANNGGFAGIRTKLFKTPFDCSECKGIKIKMKGDGQRYKLILRDDADWNGIAWSHSIDTKKGSSLERSIPFDAFKPTRFARVLQNIRPYDKSQVTGMQLSLSKFEYDGTLNPNFKEGNFELDLESIETF